MRVVIIEDEIPAANRLARLLHELDEELEVVRKLDSVEAAVKYFQAGHETDLIFMDIQLADGISFDIFNQVDPRAPVIFTTAYDQYTLKAFKVNSIDYLLKPIDEGELAQAVKKFRVLYDDQNKELPARILKLVQEMNAGRYRERLLIRKGQQFSYLKVESVACCLADGKLCYAIDFGNNKFLLDINLSQLEEQLQPTHFYRINRHLLVNIEAINKVHTWIGGRLKLELQPPVKADTIVSRERVNGFKEWLGR